MEKLTTIINSSPLPIYYYISILIVFLTLIMVYVSAKVGHPLWRTIKSIISGILMIFAANIASPLTGITIPINVLNLSVAAIFGLPGIGTISILNALTL